MKELRVEVVPPWPFRLGGGSADGLMRRRGDSLQRLLHLDGERVHVGIVQPAGDRVLFAARARTEAAAAEGIARMRFATGVDDDLRPFYDRFKDDPVIGKAVRSHPRLRVRRRLDHPRLVRHDRQAVDDLRLDFSVLVHHEGSTLVHRAEVSGGCVSAPSGAGAWCRTRGPSTGR